jgi:putative PIN family toxin of toxin-antitoxin system
MKLVIDTNIIVSGLLTPFGNSAEILRLFANDKLTIHYDSRILTEYDKVLNRPKFNFDKGKISTILKEIELSGKLVVGIPLKESLPDPDDNMFLEVALAGKVECIVTGNLNHFPQNSCFGIPIFSPSEFVNYYRKKGI